MSAACIVANVKLTGQAGHEDDRRPLMLVEGA